MKKLIAMLLALIMVFSLIACGAQKDSGQPAADAPAADAPAADAPAADAPAAEPVELTVWVPTGSNDLWFQTVKPEFEANNPGITLNVEVQDYNEYYTILKTALMGGDAPDVTWCAAFAADEYIEAGYAKDISAYYGQYPWEDALGSSIVNQITRDGAQYYVPVDAPNGPIFYYNKEVFSDLGLTIPVTDAEFFALVQKVKDAGYIATAAGNKDLYLFPQTFTTFLQNYMTQEQQENFLFNSADFDFTSEAAVKAMTRMYEYFDKVYDSSSNAWSIADTESLMIAGDAAIVHKDSYWLAADRISSKMPKLGEELGTFFLPAVDSSAKPNYRVGINATYFMTSECENTDAAAKLLDYLISKEAQASSALAGMAPVAQGVEIDASAGILMNENYKVRASAQQDANYGIFCGADLNDAISRVLQDAFAGVYATPEEACQAIEDSK